MPSKDSFSCSFVIFHYTANVFLLVLMSVGMALGVVLFSGNILKCFLLTLNCF